MSAVAILGPMLSVPGEVPGFTGEGSNQHAKSEATSRGHIRAHRFRKVHFRHFWNSGHGGTQQIKRAREGTLTLVACVGSFVVLWREGIGFYNILRHTGVQVVTGYYLEQT